MHTIYIFGNCIVLYNNTRLFENIKNMLLLNRTIGIGPESNSELPRQIMTLGAPRVSQVFKGYPKLTVI